MSISQPNREDDSFVIGNIEVFPAYCTDSSFFTEHDNHTFLFVSASLSTEDQRAEAVRAISEKGVLTI